MAEFKYWARPVELWICEYWAFCKSKFVVLLGFGMYYDSYEAKKKLSWQCQDFEKIVCSIPLWRCVLIRVFLKRHFEKKIKNPTQYATGVHLGRIYPEGEDDLTSLGGR